MTRAIRIYLALSLVLLGPLWADEPAFRLAGIIAPEDGRAIALIELPTGQQQLVRAGDDIGGGRVAAVSAEHVRLELPEGSVVLELSNSDQDRLYLPPVAAAEGPVMMDSDRRTRLETLVTKADEIDKETLARRLAAELQLAANQRIATINGTPIQDAMTAARAIAHELSAQEEPGAMLKLVVTFAEPSRQKFRDYYLAGHGDLPPNSE